MSNTSVSIQSVENLLPKELLELLQPFQVDQIKNMISSFLVMNFSVHEYVFEYCPKCGVHHPVLIKAGKANSGKQMYQTYRAPPVFNYSAAHIVTLFMSQLKSHQIVG